MLAIERIRFCQQRARRRCAWCLVGLLAAVGSLGCTARAEQSQPANRSREALGGNEAAKGDEDVHWFGSAEAAFRTILRREHPLILGVGEYHETNDAKAATPAIRHFQRELLPMVRRATDVIIETWITKGTCGRKEEQVKAEVTETTKRPESTEDDIVLLFRRAVKFGIQPHLLELTCKEYDQVRPKHGKVDYDVLLKVLTRKLGEGIKQAWLMREGMGSPNGRRKPLVLVYGGGVHNDLYPEAEAVPYSYARELPDVLSSRYVEVDLYVPEYVENDPDMQKQPWFRHYDPALSRNKVLLYKRDERSYILVFKRTAPPPAAQEH